MSLTTCWKIYPYNYSVNPQRPAGVLFRGTSKPLLRGTFLFWSHQLEWWWRDPFILKITGITISACVGLEKFQFLKVSFLFFSNEGIKLQWPGYNLTLDITDLFYSLVQYGDQEWSGGAAAEWQLPRLLQIRNAKRKDGTVRCELCQKCELCLILVEAKRLRFTRMVSESRLLCSEHCGAAGLSSLFWACSDAHVSNI